jgi:hypothetical protein
MGKLDVLTSIEQVLVYFKENACGRQLSQRIGHQLVSVNAGLGQFLGVLIRGEF